MNEITPPLTEKARAQREQDAQVLAEVGHALFGHRWQTQMAPVLRIGARHIRRYLANEHPIQSYIWKRTDEALHRRIKELTDLRKAVGRAYIRQKAAGS